MFHATFPDDPLYVLVDYFGREVTDSLAVCAAFPELAAESAQPALRTLGLRPSSGGLQRPVLLGPDSDDAAFGVLWNIKKELRSRAHPTKSSFLRKWLRVLQPVSKRLPTLRVCLLLHRSTTKAKRQNILSFFIQGKMVSCGHQDSTELQACNTRFVLKKNSCRPRPSHFFGTPE